MSETSFTHPQRSSSTRPGIALSPVGGVPVTDRVTELEIKVAFLENHIGELDGIIHQLVQRMERAEREIGELREERSAASTLGSPEEEVPPHHVRL